MGCTQSRAGTPQSRNFSRMEPPSPMERPALLSGQVVPDEVKEVLWAIIEKDDVRRLAFVVQHEAIDLRAEVVHGGSFWTMLHLACRWNAALCVALLLRRLFQQDSSTYIQSVNMQSAEGYTPLQLTAIWGSEQCFVELIEAGGVDLSMKDVNGVDIFIQARTYRRQGMLKELMHFKGEGVLLVQANLEELSKPLHIDDVLGKSKEQISKIKQRRRLRGEKMETRRNTGKSNYQIKQNQGMVRVSEAMKKLVEGHSSQGEQNQLRLLRLEQSRRGLLEEEELRRKQKSGVQIKQQSVGDTTTLHVVASEQEGSRSKQQMRLIEEHQQHEQGVQRQKEQFIRRQREIQADGQRQLREMVERQRMEEQTRLLQQQKKQQQLRKEEELLLEISRKEAQQLRKNQEEEVQRAIEQGAHQADQQRKEQEKQRLVEEKKKRYAQQLDTMKKSALNGSLLPQIPSKSVIKVAKPSGTLPPQLQQLYNDALAKGVNFVDQEFPPQRSTLGAPKKPSKTLESSVWLRPSEIFGSSYQVFDGIDPEDIKQGSLGVCYYLATLASLAEKPDRIRRMFTFFDKDLGFYVISLYVNGQPKNIIVDDFFPCVKGTKQPLFTKPNGKEIWVMLLEKAWVKNFGSYFSAQGMSADTMMEDVAGAPSRGVWIKDMSKQFRLLVGYQTSNYVTVLSSLSNSVPKGIVAGHAYTLINIYNLQQQPQLLKIRNPWGSFEWQGEYGDKSDMWSSSLKDRLNVKDAEDGIFYMTPKEVPIGFTYYSVSMVKENSNYSSLRFNSKPMEDKFWTFVVPRRAAVNIRVTQLFDRFLKDPDYKYSPMVIECGWIKSPQEVVFIGQGSDNSVFGQKSVHFHQDLLLDLQPGQYFVRVKVFWTSQKYRSGQIVCYSDAQITLVEKTQAQLQEAWHSMLLYVLSSCPKQPMVSGNVSMSQKWMKGQYIIGLTNNNNKCSYQMTIKMQQGNLVECELVYGKTGPNELKALLKPGETRLFGIVSKRRLNFSSTVGKIGFQALGVS